MNYFKNMAITFIACVFATIAANAQDGATYVLYPYSEVRVNSEFLASVTDTENWSTSIQAYVSTSDQVLEAWCNGLGENAAAIAISTTKAADILGDGCGAARDSATMVIEVPKGRFTSNFADLSNAETDNLYFYLRNQGSDEFSALSAIGKGLLVDPYLNEGPHIFSIGRQSGIENGFFPNFCQMCGCCTEINQ